MKVIDLTHTILEDMPVFPGSETQNQPQKAPTKRMVLKKHSSKSILM